MDRKWWTLLVVCAATFMLLLDVTVVVVALPTVQKSLNTSFTDIQWVIDAYALTLAAVLLTGGSLADRYGRRRLFTIGLVVFTAASALCGAAQDPLMLIVSRAVQGIGASIMFATSLALLAQSFLGKDRGTAFGIWGAITGTAVGLGPLLGGALTSALSWRYIFWVNLPIGIAALVLTRWRVPESRIPHATTPDWAGFGTLTAGLVSLVYGLIRAGQHSWTETGVVICLCLAVVLLAAFVAVEAKAPHPLLDLRLFRVPTFGGGLIAAFAMNGSLFAMFLYLVIYLQDVLGYSALGTGIRLLLVSGISLIVATAAGKLSQLIPARWLVGPGLILVGIALLFMSGLDATSGWTHLIPGFIAAGIGVGLVNPPLASTAVSVVPPREAGMASGANTTLRQIGIAVGIAVYGTTFTNRLQTGLMHQFSSTDLARQVPAITTAVTQGQTDTLFTSAPATTKAELAAAIRTAFTEALNDLLLISGILALVGGVLAFTLIRSKDFAVPSAGDRPDPSGAEFAQTTTVQSPRPDSNHGPK